MVTEFAKEMIKNADSCGAQDIYVIPRQDNYELYMRVGQERRLIGDVSLRLLLLISSSFS